MSSPIINNVVVDAAISSLTISGTGFEPGVVSPSVQFNGSSLTLTSYSNTSIIATLPSGLASGTYALVVSNSDNFSCPAEFDVNISNPPSSLFGFANTTGNGLTGYATNVSVSSTPLSIPSMGVSPNADGKSYLYGIGITGHYLVGVLSSPLSVGAGTLSAYLSNVTQSTVSDTVTISSGGIAGLSGSSYFAINWQDVVNVVISVSGSAVVLPTFEWILQG